MIGIGVLVIGMPAVFAVCLSGPEAFAVAVVHSLSQDICPVLIDLVVISGSLVTIYRGTGIVRITIIVAVALVLKPKLLLPFTL